MGPEENKAIVHFAGNDLFIGITPSGHALTLDTNHERNAAPTPMELLLLALGSCTGVDVVSILQKNASLSLTIASRCVASAATIIRGLINEWKCITLSRVATSRRSPWCKRLNFQKQSIAVSLPH